MNVSKDSVIIWRCSLCGALVHPADHENPFAWCARCNRFIEARQDGS